MGQIINGNYLELMKETIINHHNPETTLFSHNYKLVTTLCSQTKAVWQTLLTQIRLLLKSSLIRVYRVCIISYIIPLIVNYGN